MGDFKLYKSYSFKDKDPMIDEVRTVVGNQKYKSVSDESGVSASTLYNWFQGGTLRPQMATMRAVLRAQGYDLKVVKGVRSLNGKGR